MAFNIVTAFTQIANHERLVREMQEVVRNKVFYEDASNFFRIQTGIKGGQQVVAIDDFEYVTKKDQGCDNDPSKSFAITGVEQKWEPQLAKVNMKMCYTDFSDAFTRWGLANGYDIKNLGNADFFEFIRDMVSQAMQADLLRIALFSDENIASQDILTSAAKADYYNIVKKGLIPTLQAMKANGNFDDQFISLSKNNAATRAEQLTMDADYSLGLFEDLTDMVFFESDQILTSQTLYKNYKNYLRKGTSSDHPALESSKQEIQNGLESLRFDGEALTPIKYHDKKRKEDFTKDNGSGSPVTHLPHFAVNTNKDNLVIGVDDEAALTDLRLEYPGGADEYFYIKGNYQVDFKIPNPKALRAAL